MKEVSHGFSHIISRFQVKRGHFSIPVFIPTDVQEMIKGMITVDPEKRITVKYTINLSQIFKKYVLFCFLCFS